MEQRAPVSVVRRQMAHDVKYIFGIRLELARDFFGRFLLAVAQNFLDAPLQFQDTRGRLLPRFDARLMIGVDVDEAGVKADSAFVKGDKRADVEGIDLGDR